MTTENMRVFIQARMSSSRFPGKSLAPLVGRPILEHVVSSISRAVDREQIVVVSSTDSSDDPLISYCSHFLKVKTFRGNLENVFFRFQSALRKYPCTWMMRVSGDSPLIAPELIKAMMSRVRTNDDIITNVLPRTFPPGQSIEILNASTFLSVDINALSAYDREHITSHYYTQPNTYIINTIRSIDPELAKLSFTIDTLDDLNRIQAQMEQGSIPHINYLSMIDSK